MTSSEKLLLVLFINIIIIFFLFGLTQFSQEKCIPNLLPCNWELFSPLPAVTHINKTIPEEKLYLWYPEDTSSIFRFIQMNGLHGKTINKLQ